MPTPKLSKAQRETGKKVLDALSKMESVKAFAFIVSKSASGLLLDLVEAGKSETQARTSIIHYLLDFASGEACRIARREGRKPDQKKWRKATDDAFKRAVKRTAGREALKANK